MLPESLTFALPLKDFAPAIEEAVSKILNDGVALSVLFLLAAALLAISYDRYRLRPTRGLRLRAENAWGTVYVLQDKRWPGIYKVGFTSRRIADRKAEIVREMTADRDLRLIFAIDMMHAKQVETVAHRRLRKFRAPKTRHHTGREWFLLTGMNRDDRVIQTVLRSAGDVRYRARRVGRWSYQDQLRAKFWRLNRGRPKRGLVFSIFP